MTSAGSGSGSRRGRKIRGIAPNLICLYDLVKAFSYTGEFVARGFPIPILIYALTLPCFRIAQLFGAQLPFQNKMPGGVSRRLADIRINTVSRQIAGNYPEFPATRSRIANAADYYSIRQRPRRTCLHESTLEDAAFHDLLDGFIQTICRPGYRSIPGGVARFVTQFQSPVRCAGGLVKTGLSNSIRLACASQSIASLSNFCIYIRQSSEKLGRLICVLSPATNRERMHRLSCLPNAGSSDDSILSSLMSHRVMPIHA